MFAGRSEGARAAAAWRIATLLLAALASLARGEAKCALNRAVNLSEISLCGRRDWMELAIADGCAFEGFRIFAGVYDCDTGLARPTFTKRFPARLQKPKATFPSPGRLGAESVDYYTVSGLRTYALGAQRRRINCEWGDIDWYARISHSACPAIRHTLYRP
jgi:hypothetical protein